MKPAPRRGWCPGIGRPMPTGDGLLVRVHPPAGVLGAAQARAVAEAAALGNGLIDVTARANLQIRGVTERTHGLIAARLSEAGLGDVRADGGPQRLTLASPLATLDPALMALVEAIEAAGRAVPGLPAKALVAVEGRGLGAVEADIRVRAVGPSDLATAMLPAPRSGRVALASTDGPLWTAPMAGVSLTDALAALLRGFAASGARRLRDLG
ncbi:MAG: nitrite reductase, partial [Methylobacterium sp.]|nr:nitrite reductase [Methylobacterium sp.]